MSMRARVESFFKRGNTAAAIGEDPNAVLTDKAAETTPALPETPTLDEVLHRISKYEGLCFTDHNAEGEVGFTHHSEQFGIRINHADLSWFIPRMEKCLDMLKAMKEEGTTEIKIPTDVYFHPFSAHFSEHVSTKPTDREPTAKTSNGWMTTKDTVETDVLIEAYEESIGQFKEAEHAPKKGGHAESIEESRGATRYR